MFVYKNHQILPAVKGSNVEEDADAFVGQGWDGQWDPATEEWPAVKCVLPLKRDVDLVGRDLPLKRSNLVIVAAEKVKSSSLKHEYRNVKTNIHSVLLSLEVARCNPMNIDTTLE